MKNGEVLTPESPLFRPYGGESRFMIRNNVSDAIRRAMRDAGLQGRPYIWRSYYAHYCQQVESKGFLEAWRKFFMGHKGNIQTLYANRKANIPPGSIELMRQSYELALPLLETGEDRHQDPTMRMVALVLRSAKATSEHVQRLNLDSSTEDELVQILEDAIKASLVSRAETLSAATEPEAFRQRLVQPNELAQALQEGWFIKLQLSDGQVVVERHTLYTQTPAKHVPLAA
jgi:hypothetical protein